MAFGKCLGETKKNSVKQIKSANESESAIVGHNYWIAMTHFGNVGLAKNVCDRLCAYVVKYESSIISDPPLGARAQLAFNYFRNMHPPFDNRFWDETA